MCDICLLFSFWSYLQVFLLVMIQKVIVFRLQIWIFYFPKKYCSYCNLRNEKCLYFNMDPDTQ